MAEELFARLDNALAENIDVKYFSEPREFRYIGSLKKLQRS